jgi:GH15 family glucan-1,4-alpha-glucosidase
MVTRMASAIEDYALVGDTESAALVGRDGSIDWLCLPRFDSPACFAALLGDARHGRWLVAPVEAATTVRRRYRNETLVLETELDTPEGTVRLVDFMPPRERTARIVRLVEGVRGRVRMRMELALRFDYGRIRPWLRRVDGAWTAIAGPECARLDTPLAVRADDATLSAEFVVAAGALVPLTLEWFPSHQPAPPPSDALQALGATESFWTRWLASCNYDGEWREAVVRSLITLKALTYAPTGGIVAAPTTSLPEAIGGVRNWDYRFCWLRDAAVTLLALTRAGFRDEAQAWHRWLLRAVAGDPADAQIMYGVAGERRLTERELEWLPGYERSRPVRVGNAAADQLQLDVYGEVLGALHAARSAGLDGNGELWGLTRAFVEFLGTHWQLPDDGIWESRGPRRQYVTSKVMAWTAVDRAVADAETHGFAAPLARWRALRDEIRREIEARGFDHARGTFTRWYGSQALDASSLLIPFVGFLPADDERVRGTVAAVERNLVRDGLVYRYTPSRDIRTDDGLPPGEGAFFACSFWLAGNYAYAGRMEEARELFERLLSLRNDVGLLAEEYDPVGRRQLGNFPQAFSHVPLIMAAFALGGERAATPRRSAARRVRA